MARKTETRTIDGVSYRVTQMGAYDALKVERRASRVIALGLAQVEGTTGNQAAMIGAFGRALAEGLSDEDLKLVVDAFAKVTDFQTEGMRSGDRWLPLLDHYDDHFAGGALRQFHWLRFAIEVNFADFFAEYERRSNPAQAAGPSRS